MNRFHILRPALVASLVALPLAACSSGATQFDPASSAIAPITTPQQRGESAAPKVASLNDSRVQRYLPIQPIVTAGGGCIFLSWPGGGVWHIVTIPAGCIPKGLGSWGVAESSADKSWLVGESTASSNYIAVYNRKFKQVGALTGLTGEPVGVATDSKADVWATNFPSNTLAEYDHGSTTPSATYTDGNLSTLRYVAIDQNDDVYVSGQSAGSGSLEVDELQGSAFTPVKTITGAVGAGLAIAPNKRILWVCDEGNGTRGVISGYTIPGFKRRTYFGYSGDDTGIAVAPSEKQLYAVDNVADGSEFDVSVVIYNPKTGKAVNTSPSITSPVKFFGIASSR